MKALGIYLDWDIPSHAVFIGTLSEGNTILAGKMVCESENPMEVLRRTFPVEVIYLSAAVRYSANVLGYSVRIVGAEIETHLRAVPTFLRKVQEDRPIVYKSTTTRHIGQMEEDLISIMGHSIDMNIKPFTLWVGSTRWDYLHFGRSQL